jgi:hypothetical protein
VIFKTADCSCIFGQGEGSYDQNTKHFFVILRLCIAVLVFHVKNV